MGDIVVDREEADWVAGFSSVTNTLAELLDITSIVQRDRDGVAHLSEVAEALLDKAGITTPGGRRGAKVALMELIDLI